MDADEKDMIDAIKNKDVKAFNEAQASYDNKAKQFIEEAQGILVTIVIIYLNHKENKINK